MVEKLSSRIDLRQASKGHGSSDKDPFANVIESPSHEVIETSQVIAGFDEMVSIYAEDISQASNIHVFTK
jgi:hypothetical protein